MDYPDLPLKEDEVADVPDAVGAMLVKRGHAEVVDEPKPQPKLAKADK